VASMNALQIERDDDLSYEPQTGGIYRDATNRSFVVLRVRPEGVFVEYADGTTRSVSKNGWSLLGARPALC
jgi:hypothetical protein